MNWRYPMVLAPLLAFSGCGKTVYLDNFNATPVAQPPSPPDVGTSTSGGDAVVAAHPQDPASSDRWLRLTRTVPTQEGGRYVGTLSETLKNTKASVVLVGYVPSAAPMVMSVFFETKDLPQQIPLLHIDLLPNGEIRLNDNQVVGTFKFDTLVGFVVGFDLTSAAPTASVTVTGGGNDAGVTVPVEINAASFGLGRIRVFAPFEGVDAPAGSFLVNDILVTRPSM